MTYIDVLLEKHFNKSVLIDTNLLLLLLYGVVNRDSIPTRKRTAGYLPEDFDLLYKLASKFKVLIYTPHILAETSNLIETADQNFYNQVVHVLKTLIAEKTEIFTESALLADIAPFVKFGLTDTAIYDIASSGKLVISACKKTGYFSVF